MEVRWPLGSVGRAAFAATWACVVIGLHTAPAAVARADDTFTQLLKDRSPIARSGVQRAGVLTDGRAAQDGSFWKTRLSARFEDVASHVDYDLGELRVVNAAWLQGDNDDTYRVEGSTDGHTFTKLWDAPRVDGAGLQVRETQSLAVQVRYVRLRALQGDGNFAVSELQLLSGHGRSLPLPEPRSAVPLGDRLRDQSLIFGLGMLAVLLLPARPRRWLGVLALVVAAASCFRFAQVLWDAWPAQPREVSLLRGTLAFVGAAAIAREAFSPARWPASRAVCLSVLALCASLAFTCFYDLGHPQFWNAHQGRWSFAHLLDLRQYYPTAKYFRELSYTRIYDADIAAYEDLTANRNRAELDERLVRDLETFEEVKVADRRAAIESIRSRFTKERWADYVADTDWFRRSMGEQAFLDTLIDFGGNATPVWISIAHGLFSLVPPSDTAFVATGLIDLALLLAAFIAIARVFGVRSMFACTLIFGATDFVMYGTNWAGATLRHDWMAYLAFGLCALRRERWVMGGAWLGLATMIRAFPILALVGAALPALMRVVSEFSRTRRLPPLRELFTRERATLNIALGAIIAAVVTIGMSIAILGPHAWIEWWTKVAKIESDPHPASVALRNLIAGSAEQARLLRARWPVYVAVIALFCGSVAWLGRKVNTERAAVLGLCLVPVVFYPANYYLHFVYLWPLLAVERRGEAPAIAPRDAWLWMIAFGMCAAQYFTTLETDVALHFYYSTVTLFAALAAMFGVMLAYDTDLRAWLAREPSGPSAPG